MYTIDKGMTHFIENNKKDILTISNALVALVPDKHRHQVALNQYGPDVDVTPYNTFTWLLMHGIYEPKAIASPEMEYEVEGGWLGCKVVPYFQPKLI